MSFFNNLDSDSVLGKRRKGTSEDPFIDISEGKQIVGGRVALSEIPNALNKVTVTGNSTTWFEITYGLPTSIQYVVDYSTGIVSFDSSNNLKTLTFAYKGEGVINFPASRVWTQRNGNDITETLDESLASIDTVASSLQTQINTNNQSLNNHINSTTAHSAAKISFTGSGMSSTNVQTGVKEAWDKASAIVATSGSSNTELLDIRTVESGYTPSRTIAVAGDAIRDMQSKFAEQSNQTVTLKHGLNVINTNQGSSTNVAAYGRTLVNAIGKDGNCESTSGWVINSSTVSVLSDYTSKTQGDCSLKVTILTGTWGSTYRNLSNTNLIDKTKYYVMLMDIKNGNATNGGRILVDGTGMTSKTGQYITSTASYGTSYVKISPSDMASATSMAIHVHLTGTVGQYVNADGVRVFEITATEYAKIDVDPEWTGVKLADKFPYVDGVKHAQGMAIKKAGKNLLQSFTDTVNPDSSLIGPYSLLTVTTGTFKNNDILTDSVPGQAYTFSITKDSVGGYAEASFLDSNGTLVGTAQSAWTVSKAAGTYSTTMTAPAGSVKARLRLTNMIAGTHGFTNWQIESGSTTTPFQPYNADYIYLPTALASNLDGSVRDITYERENVWYKYKKWNVGISLGGVTWNNHTAASVAGSKRAYITSLLPSFNTDANARAMSRLVKHDGTTMKYLDPGSDVESYTIGNVDGNVYISVPNSITGFSDAFTPPSADWVTFSRGWRINNGTLGTAYSGTGTKYWTALDSPKANFIGKVAGSIVENPHIRKSVSGSSLQIPTSGVWSERTQPVYDAEMTLDGNFTTTTALSSGVMRMELFSFNLIEHVLRKYGSAIFGAATTTADRVTWLKANVASANCNLYGYGSGPAGNKLSFALWNTAGAGYDTVATHTNAVVTKISRAMVLATTNRIDANGFIHFIAYADASDGVIASTVCIDFIELEVELNVQTVPTTGLATTEFKPYTIDYVLATPVEEVITNAEGMISLASGGNQVELFEGVIVREKANPSLYSNKYYINLSAISNGATKLKYRVAKILGVYKNGQLDNKWIFTDRTAQGDAYGNYHTSIEQVDYDVAAEYTVTYTVLDKYSYTTNTIEATLNYQGSQKSVVDTLVQKIADDETKVQIQAMQLVNIIARLKAANI